MTLSNKLLIIIFATFCMFNVTAQADTRNTIIVFDASGSMWGQIDGKSKIEIARDAFNNLENNWQSTNDNIGLIAYGHNRKGDCSDIEMLVDPKVGNINRVSKAISTLRPKGKTPLSDAVKMAAQKLKYQEEKATVILFSDGIETCNADPCALSTELTADGIDFTAHVIGFAITKSKDRQQLQCIAENSGGQYFDTNNANELGVALNSITNDKKPVVIKSTTQMVELSVDILEAKGTYRPVQVTLKATNSNTGEIIVLGTLTDAQQVVEGWHGTIPAGQWKIEAISTEGYGGITTIVSKQNASLKVPFSAFPLSFTLEDNGPYLLGVEHIMLLTPTAAIQNNAQLKVAMFPEATLDYSQRMDFSYQFGAKAGQVLAHYFDTPTTPGNYDIVVMSGNDLNDVIFRQTIRYETNVTPVWLGSRQGAANALLPVQISGMNNPYATLVLSKDGHKIWDSRFYDLVTNDGLFMPLPAKKGGYELSLKYKNAQGKKVETDFGTITVGTAIQEDDIDAVAAPSNTTGIKNSKSQIKMQLGYWVLAQRFTGDEITTIEVVDESLRAEMPYKNDPNTPMGRGDALSIQSLTLVDDKLNVKFQTEFGTAEGMLIYTDDGFEGTLASAKGEVFVPVRLDHFGDIGLDATAHGNVPQDISGDKAAYLCDQAFCNQIAQDFELTWALPNGWSATAPFYYATAGGSQAKLPTMDFMIEQSGANPFAAVLNPRQWMAANGPCYKVTRGELCKMLNFSEKDELSFSSLLSSLREVPLSTTPLKAADIEIYFKNQKGQ